MSYKKKALPNPAFPLEVFKYYIFYLLMFLKRKFKNVIKDPLKIKHKKKYQKLFDIKKSKTGNSCFVLANGPSLKKINPHKLKKYCEKTKSEIFCLSHFPNSEFSQITGYDYWLLSDDKWMRQDGSEIEERYLRTINKVNQNLKKTVFIPSNYIKRFHDVFKKEVIGFNDKEIPSFLSNSIDPTLPRSYVSMSAYKALAIACHMGFGPIYICGFDNSYVNNLRNDKYNNIYGLVEHFDSVAYDYKSSDPRSNLAYNYRTVADELISKSRLFSDLEKFKEYKIFNLDIESLTDAFPKVDDIDLYVNEDK
jgi:hypothetical protein